MSKMGIHLKKKRSKIDSSKQQIEANCIVSILMQFAEFRFATEFYYNLVNEDFILKLKGCNC